MAHTPRKNKWSVGRAACLILLIFLFGSVLWYWREPLWAFFEDQERLRAWVTSFGPWAPAASIALNVVQVLLAPIPGQFVGLINGYLYGVGLGTFYSMVGLLLGSLIAMSLGRWFGRPAVEHFVNPEQLSRWDSITVQQGPLFFFLIFLFPLVPDDIACFLIGLSSLSIPRMLFMATLGRTPGVFVSCWIGAYATRLPWWVWIPLGLGSAGLAWLFWRYQSQLESQILRLIKRIHHSLLL